jgi:hypothetical protein
MTTRFDALLRVRTSKQVRSGGVAKTGSNSLFLGLEIARVLNWDGVPETICGFLLASVGDLAEPLAMRRTEESTSEISDGPSSTTKMMTRY